MKTSPWYRFFKAQIDKNKVSHAYLLVGTQAFSVAKEMSQILLCDHQTGCGQCPSCHRVIENVHANLKRLPSIDGSLKKEQVQKLKSSFSQTSLEKDKRQIYIIEDIDKASLAALNSLLKFLEEPEGDVVAILTTNHQDRVLDTIQSRCLVMHVDKDIDKSTWLNDFDLEQDYLNILKTYADTEENFRRYAEDERYHEAYQLVKEYFASKDPKNHVIFYHHLTNRFKPSQEELHFILEVMKGHTKDSLVLKAILETQDTLRPGLNVNLLIDQLMGAIL